jgi:hypothetical protein
METYRSFGGRIADEFNDATAFMPFAGTEGYNQVAYIPYTVAEGIGRLLRLEFPDRLLLIRLFGLVTFTAVAAYAIAVTPVLKWAFVLIALLPVSLYNRSVLSADGAALCSAHGQSGARAEGRDKRPRRPLSRAPRRCPSRRQSRSPPENNPRQGQSRDNRRKIRQAART